METTVVRAADAITRSLDSEPPLSALVARHARLQSPHVGIVRRAVIERDSFLDEPFIPAARAEIGAAPHALFRYPVGGAATGGRHRSPQVALAAAIFEGYERYCLSSCLPSSFSIATHQELESQGRHALDLDLLGASSSLPRAMKSVPYRWTSVTDLFTDSEVLVPTQLVYLPYRLLEGEPWLRDPITTGTAAGSSMWAALARGLLEAVERDSAMLSHYVPEVRTPLSAHIDYFGDPAALVEDLQARGLTVDVNLIRSGAPAHSVAVRIVDPLERFPSQTFGTAASLNLEEAIDGALLEAATYRRARRLRASGGDSEPRPSADSIRSLQERADYWCATPRDTSLDRDWSTLRSDDEPLHLGDYSWRDLLEWCGTLPGGLLYADVTTEDVKALGVRVVRTVVPALQPMHLNEARSIQTERLIAVARSHGRSVACLSAMAPHPYL